MTPALAQLIRILARAAAAEAARPRPPAETR